MPYDFAIQVLEAHNSDYRLIEDASEYHNLLNQVIPKVDPRLAPSIQFITLQHSDI